MTQISVCAFNPDVHYIEICSWWKFHNWPSIPLSALPKNGIVVIADGVMAVAGWIYQTDSDICLLEWFIANPKVRRFKRSESIDCLLRVAKDAAKKMGFKTIFTTAKNESLIGRMEKSGFSIGERSMTNLTFDLSGGI